MNTNQKIQNAFNQRGSKEVENVYIPKVKSTTRNKIHGFNEISKNIKQQLLKKYKYDV